MTSTRTGMAHPRLPAEALQGGRRARQMLVGLCAGVLLGVGTSTLAAGGGDGTGPGTGQGRGSGTGQGDASGAAAADTSSRQRGANCKEGLELEYRGKRLWHRSVDAVLKDKQAARHEAIRSGAVSLPLQALLEAAPEASVLVVMSCAGRSVRVRATDLLDGEEHMLLSPSRRGSLKLVQLRGTRKPRTLMNRVSRVVLQDAGEHRRLRAAGADAETAEDR